MRMARVKNGFVDGAKTWGQTALSARRRTHDPCPKAGGRLGTEWSVPRFSQSPVRAHGEKGFALLFVFLMAAVIGLYLYWQLPRVAFESERDKEQLLIDRGEQYKRAIQLYVIAVKRYPQKIEDLEDTNEKRYLRQRYIDPMTGKDEWRLIHVNAAGILTDSLVQKPPAPNTTGQPGASNTGTGTGLGTTAASTFGSPTGNTPGVNPNPGAPTPTPDPNDVNSAVRKRPSDVVGGRLIRLRRMRIRTIPARGVRSR